MLPLYFSWQLISCCSLAHYAIICTVAIGWLSFSFWALKFGKFTLNYVLSTNQFSICWLQVANSSDQFSCFLWKEYTFCPVRMYWWHLDSIKIWKMKHHFLALGQFLHVDLWTWVYETQKKEGCLTCSRVSMAEWTQKSIFWKRRKKCYMIFCQSLTLHFCILQ